MILLPMWGLSQRVGINPSGANPDPSSVLDLASENHGMLTPRMTQAEMNAIASPATGLLVFQTDGKPGFRFYDGNEWHYLRGMVSAPGRIATEEITCNTTLTVGSGFTGFSHVVNCITGEGTVTWGGGLYDDPPVVTLASSIVPVPPPAPDIYCPNFYTAPCNTPGNADQIIGVQIQQGTAAGGPWTTIMQHMSGCDAPANGNYVVVPESVATATLSGNLGPCPAPNWYRVGIASSTEWNDRVQAYIDWNSDGDFFGAQEHIAPICDWGLSGQGGAFLFSAPFQVPDFALNGNTVLRCRSIWTPQCNPCVGQTFGETEDYTVTIQCATSGPSPEIPTYCAITDVGTTFFDFKCTLLSGAPIIPPLVNFDLVPADEP